MLLDSTASESDVKALLRSREQLVKLVFEKRWIGEISILRNFTIDSNTVDFAVVRVEGPASNAGDGHHDRHRW